jgi:outer membrane biogenesis lipoprotein LolB
MGEYACRRMREMPTLSIAIAGVAIVLLYGCSSSHWAKAGVTEQQLAQDTADCLTTAQYDVPARGGLRTTVDQSLYRNCMHDRGYTADTTTK